VNAPDSVGVGHVPRNRAGKYRESTLITHITPARSRKNFEVRGDTLALRVIHERGRATGVEVDGPNGIEVIPADRVALSAGAFISPMILMHSGIGDPEELGRVGIETTVELPGVGNNLRTIRVCRSLPKPSTPSLVYTDSGSTRDTVPGLAPRTTSP